MGKIVCVPDFCQNHRLRSGALVLLILWRIGVIPVAISIPNLPVGPVNYHFALLLNGLRSRCVNCLRLSAVRGAGPLPALSFRGPTFVMWHNVDSLFGHFDYLALVFGRLGGFGAFACAFPPKPCPPSLIVYGMHSSSSSSRCFGCSVCARHPPRACTKKNRQARSGFRPLAYRSNRSYEPRGHHWLGHSCSHNSSPFLRPFQLTAVRNWQPIAYN